MSKLLPLLLLSLFAFSWEPKNSLWDIPEDLIEGNFNTLGDGTVIGGLCLYLKNSDDPLAKQAGKDSLNAFLTAGAVTLLLKKMTHCKRPTGDKYDSFPSGHTAVAFASARVFSHYYPEHKVVYYLLAIGVAVARVQSKAHYIRDVIGGAIVGYWGGDMALEGKGIIPLIKKKF